MARLFTAVACAVPATTAFAGTIVVTHFDDVIDQTDGTCTLREAVLTANADVAVDACSIAGTAGEDLIVLTAGTYAVDLASGTAEDASADGDLDIVSSLEIRGIAPDYTIIDGDADTSRERVIDIGPNVAVTIRGVTITGGHEPAGEGGNIFQEDSGTTEGLTLRDVVIHEGRSRAGGGIWADGAVELWRTVVRDNEAVATAIDNGFGGGIAFLGQSLTVRESEINDNRAVSGGGIYALSSGPWTVFDSRLTDNVADGGSGGGIASEAGSVTVIRTLIEGNEAASGGGLWLGSSGDLVTHSAIIGNTASENGGGVYGTADAFVRHSTLAGNEAASGGGVYAASPTMLLLDAVTLAGNTGGGGVFNESGAFFETSILADNAGDNCVGDPPGAGAYNLEDAETCGFPTNDPDRPGFVNTDPVLGPLQDNGGGLPTFALLEGSPAIDAASSIVRTNCQNTPDQRGYPRGWPPILTAGQDPEFLCDIGAFEQHAAYVVDTTADTVDVLEEDGVCADAAGTCSLRAAITTANSVPGLEEIELGADTYAITLAGGNEDGNETGDFDIKEVVVIRGQGAGQTIIDAAQLDRALHFPESMAAKFPLTPRLSTLSDLSIRQGAADEGGGISAGRPLRLERTILEDNSAATGNGGAILCADGCELRVIDSALRANTAPSHRGGAIAHTSDIALHLERTTLSGNSAGEAGAVDAEELRVLNSTFSGNSGGSPAAFFANRAVLESSTVFDNETEAGMSVRGAIASVEPTVIGNSIVAGNRVNGAADNCGFNPGELVSVGFNLTDTDSTDCDFTHTTDLLATDPLLEALAGNDGAVQTHALTAESPAIDAGDDERCPAMDQRGIARPADGDGDGTAVCDIGAFELQPESEPPGGDGDGDGGDDGDGNDGGAGNGGADGGGSGGGGAISWPIWLGLPALCRRRSYGPGVAALDARCRSSRRLTTSLSVRPFVLSSTRKWKRRSAASSSCSARSPAAAASTSSTASSPTFCAIRRSPDAASPAT